MTGKQRSYIGWGPISKVACLAVVLVTSGVAWAQAPAADCFPPCRQGYLCHAGQCILACNPACGAGQICTSQGQCVSACNPPCAPNEVCVAAGQCVQQGPAAAPAPIAPAVASQPTSLPPVAAAAPQLGMPANAPANPTSPMAGNSPEMYDTGWAQGASIFGYVSASATLALTGAVIATNASSNGDTPRNLGIAATTLVIAS